MTDDYKYLSEKLLEFNTNYFGHDFILSSDQVWSGLNIYCKKCNIRVFYYSPSSYEMSKYILRSQLVSQGFETILTCDEYIIKNIIE